VRVLFCNGARAALAVVNLRYQPDRRAGALHGPFFLNDAGRVSHLGPARALRRRKKGEKLHNNSRLAYGGDFASGIDTYLG